MNCIICFPSEEMKNMSYEQKQNLIVNDKSAVCPECHDVLEFFRI
jgi:hypothetical protein